MRSTGSNSFLPCFLWPGLEDVLIDTWDAYLKPSAISTQVASASQNLERSLRWVARGVMKKFTSNSNGTLWYLDSVGAEVTAESATHSTRSRLPFVKKRVSHETLDSFKFKSSLCSLPNTATMSDFEDDMDIDAPAPRDTITFSSDNTTKGKRSAANLPVEAEDTLPW